MIERIRHKLSDWLGLSALWASLRNLRDHELLPQNFSMRLSGIEASLRLLEKRLLAIEALAGPDGEQLGLAGKKTADLLEAVAVLRRDKSAAEVRGMSLENYRAEKANRPSPPKAPELPEHESKEWKV